MISEKLMKFGIHRYTPQSTADQGEADSFIKNKTKLENLIYSL